MTDRQRLARFAAPAAFLLAVTILVLLVRAAMSADEPASSPPAATLPAPTTTQTPVTTEETETDAAGTETEAATTAEEGPTYTIQSGDTLESIADQHGTSVEELLTLNPEIDPTNLQIGQTIRVP